MRKIQTLASPKNGVGKTLKSEVKKQIRLKDGIYLVDTVSQDRIKKAYTVIVDGSSVIYTGASGLIRTAKGPFFKQFQSFNISDTNTDPEFALSLLKESIIRTKGF